MKKAIEHFDDQAMREMGDPRYVQVRARQAEAEKSREDTQEAARVARLHEAELLERKAAQDRETRRERAEWAARETDADQVLCAEYDRLEHAKSMQYKRRQIHAAKVKRRGWWNFAGWTMR